MDREYGFNDRLNHGERANLANSSAFFLQVRLVIDELEGVYG
jgi:hypothetical protein